MWRKRVVVSAVAVISSLAQAAGASMTLERMGATLEQAQRDFDSVRAGLGIFVQSKGAKAPTFVSYESLSESLTVAMLTDELDLANRPLVGGEEPPLSLNYDEAMDLMRQLKRRSDQLLIRQVERLRIAKLTYEGLLPSHRERLENTDPAGLPRMLLMADDYLKEGRPAEAERTLRDAIATNPNVAKPHQLLGNALHMQERYPAAETAYRDALRLDPNNAECRADLAGALYYQQKSQQARNEAERAARLGNRDHWVFKQLSDDDLNAALKAAQAGDNPRAQALIRQSARLPYKKAGYYANLAKVYKAQGNPEETESALHIAALANPKNPALQNEHGNALYALKQYQRARKAYARAVELNPQEPIHLANLAGALVRLDQVDEGMKYARKAASLGFGDHWVFNYPNEQGNTYYNQKNYQQAMEAYALAAELKPQEPIIQANLAGSLVRLGRVDEGIKHARKAAALGFTGHWVFNYFNEQGNTYYSQKNFQKAMEAYALAVELKPQEPVYHANLAGALAKLNRLEEARRHAKEAISRGLTEHWVYKTLGLTPEQ